jgi:hypothetical protein
MIQAYHDVNFFLRSSMAPLLLRFGVRSRKLSNVGQSLGEWPKNYYLELLRALEGTLSLHLQSLAPTNPHWGRVVGYGPFSLCIIHKEGLCPSSGDIKRLMMMKWIYYYPAVSSFSQFIVSGQASLVAHANNWTEHRWPTFRLLALNTFF